MVAHTFREAAEAAGLPHHPGKQGMQRAHRELIQNGQRMHVSGSVDLDTHFRQREPDANRLDYGIGICLHSGRRKAERVIWVEVHHGSEASCVEAKFRWLQEKLKSPDFSMLRAMTGGLEIGEHKNVAYVWLCAGCCKLPPHNQKRKRLSQRGIIYTSRLELP